MATNYKNESELEKAVIGFVAAATDYAFYGGDIEQVKEAQEIIALRLKYFDNPDSAIVKLAESANKYAALLEAAPDNKQHNVEQLQTDAFITIPYLQSEFRVRDFVQKTKVKVKEIVDSTYGLGAIKLCDATVKELPPLLADLQNSGSPNDELFESAAADFLSFFETEKNVLLLASNVDSDQQKAWKILESLVEAFDRDCFAHKSNMKDAIEHKSIVIHGDYDGGELENEGNIAIHGDFRGTGTLRSQYGSITIMGNARSNEFMSACTDISIVGELVSNSGKIEAEKGNIHIGSDAKGSFELQAKGDIAVKGSVEQPPKYAGKIESADGKITITGDVDGAVIISAQNGIEIGGDHKGTGNVITYGDITIAGKHFGDGNLTAQGKIMVGGKLLKEAGDNFAIVTSDSVEIKGTSLAQKLRPGISSKSKPDSDGMVL